MNRLLAFTTGIVILYTSGHLLCCAEESSSQLTTAQFTMDDFANVDKIDIHFHLHIKNQDVVAWARRDRFAFLNIATDSSDAESMRNTLQILSDQHQANPDRIITASAFTMRGWDEPDWQAKTIAQLDDTFAKGAVAVKIWKNIGMEFRDKDGKLVMVDNPRLDPIFRHLQQRGIVLMAHLGEPKNCWLPLEQMTVNNDRSYFAENPQYHMFHHPEMPSYQDQIDARDRMLAKHPELKFLAAHLASLEWSVDEIAKFLDRFPNAVVGTAARIGQIQYQSQKDRDKVNAFFEKYQDRVLYGTDGSVSSEEELLEKYDRIKQRWLNDWKYFNTDQMVTVWELDDPVQGLALPQSIVKKLYFENAKRLFPKSWNVKLAD